MSNNKKFTLDKSGKNSNNFTLAKPGNNYYNKSRNSSLELIDRVSELKNFDNDDGYGTDGVSDDEDSEYNIVSDDNSDNGNSSDSSGSKEGNLKTSEDNNIDDTKDQDKGSNGGLKEEEIIKLIENDEKLQDLIKKIAQKPNNEKDQQQQQLQQVQQQLQQVQQQLQQGQQQGQLQQELKKGQMGTNQNESFDFDILFETVRELKQGQEGVNENVIQIVNVLREENKRIINRLDQGDAKSDAQTADIKQTTLKGVSDLKGDFKKASENFTHSKDNLTKSWSYAKEKCWDIFFTKEKDVYEEKINEQEKVMEEAKEREEKAKEEAKYLKKTSDDEASKMNKDIHGNKGNTERYYETNDIIKDLSKMTLKTIPDDFDEFILKSYFDDNKIIGFNGILDAFNVRYINPAVFIAFVESILSIYSKYESLKNIYPEQLLVNEEGNIILTKNSPSFINIFTRFKFVDESNISFRGKVYDECLESDSSDIDYDIVEEEVDLSGGGNKKVKSECIITYVVIHEIRTMFLNILSIDKELILNPKNIDDHDLYGPEDKTTEKYYTDSDGNTLDIAALIKDHGSKLSTLPKKDWKQFIEQLPTSEKEKANQVLEKLTKIFDALYEDFNKDFIVLHKDGMRILINNQRARHEKESVEEVDMWIWETEPDHSALTEDDYISLQIKYTSYGISSSNIPLLSTMNYVNNGITKEFYAIYNYFKGNNVGSGSLILNTSGCLMAIIYLFLGLSRYFAELWYNTLVFYMAFASYIPWPFNWIIASLWVSVYIYGSWFISWILFNIMGELFGYGYLGDYIWTTIGKILYTLSEQIFLLLEHIYTWIIEFQAVKNAIAKSGIVQHFIYIRAAWKNLWETLETCFTFIKSWGSYFTPPAWQSGGGNTKNNAIILNKNSNQIISNEFISKILTDNLKMNDKVTQMMTNITNISGATPGLKNMVSTAISTQVSINSALFKSVNSYISILNNKNMHDYVLEGIGNNPNRLLLLYKMTALLNVDTDKIGSVPLSKLVFDSHRRIIKTLPLEKYIKYENPSNNKKQIQNKKSNKGGRLCKSKKKLKKLCTRSKKGKKKKGGKVTKKRIQKGKSRRKYA